MLTKHDTRMTALMTALHRAVAVHRAVADSHYWLLDTVDAETYDASQELGMSQCKKLWVEPSGKHKGTAPLQHAPWTGACNVMRLDS